MLWMGIGFGLAACAGFALWRSMFRVEEGHRAAVTCFGAALRDPADETRLLTYGPGLHLTWPWRKVHQVRLMEQHLDLPGRSAMAEDGTVLKFDSSLRYAPVENELSRFLFGMRAPLEHVTGLFTCLLRNEIANFRAEAPETGEAAPPRGGLPAVAAGGSFALIRQQRRELNERIEAFCRRDIAGRYGVRFDAVDLTDILPPHELEVALNAVVRAHSEADAAHARAEADTRRRVVAAERGVEIARARAKAAELEVETLGQFLLDLDRDGTIGRYVARRRGEVLSQSKTVFLRSAT